MEMLLDAAVTRMSGPSMRQDGVEDGAEAEFNRKRQRRLSGPPPAAGAHQCRICQRSYERADRLSRHLKTHENARRYHCQQCEKTFNRADLLTRHVMTHRRHGAGSGHVDIPRADRAGQACIACAAAKARCEDQKPCRRCCVKNITCEVPSQTAYRARQKFPGSRRSQSCSSGPESPSGNHNLTASQQSTNSTSRPDSPQENQSNHVPHATVAQQPSALGPDTNLYQPNSPVSQPTNQIDATDREVPCPASMESMIAQMDIYDMHAGPMAGDQLILDNIMNEILFMPSTADFNNQNLEINFLDFAFQEEQLVTFPGQSIKTSNEPMIVKVTNRTPVYARDVRAGYAAFTRSPWLYTPAQRDCVLRDGEDLTLDEDSITSALTPRSTGLTPNIPSCGFPTIVPVMRDRMYYLVSTMNRYTSRVPDFPSLDVINHVVEAFFVRHTYQVDNWIHIPSIAHPDVIPELGLALVIAGSTLTSVPAIWKMGLVLQDVVRVKLGELVRLLINSANCFTNFSLPV
jgi:Zinc finger, C2H2 type